jgi:hypothetical protein
MKYINQFEFTVAQPAQVCLKIVARLRNPRKCASKLWHGCAARASVPQNCGMVAQPAQVSYSLDSHLRNLCNLKK